MSGETTAAGKKKLTSAEKRERARVRRVERAARQQAAKDAWKGQMDAHFGYLQTSFGFHIAEVDASTWWETSLRYESDRVAVKVARSVEFNRVELWLIRLVGAGLPGYPIFINPDTPINYVIFDRVLEARAPAEAERLKELNGLSDEQVERSLDFLAHALRAYSNDVLRGDFAIFDTIANQIHQEVREHPQEIRVVLPDTAVPSEEVPLVQQIQQNHPEQPIRVEYYSTTRSKGAVARARMMATRNRESQAKAVPPTQRDQPPHPSGRDERGDCFT